MDFLKKLFGIGKSDEALQNAIKNGAVIIDVRTAREFEGGHIKGSKNIPLDKIQSEADKIKKMNKPIVVCCASGMRSASAKAVLQSKGVEVYNLGSWRNMSKYTQTN